MGDASAAGLIDAVLRCYPARWRRRHGAEAAELAVLLIRDGTPVGSVVLSYFLGAVRERLTPPPGRHPGAVLVALLALACSLGVSVAVLTSTVPARAASTSRAGERARCGPAPMATMRHQIAAAGHPRPGTRKARQNADGRAC